MHFRVFVYEISSLFYKSSRTSIARRLICISNRDGADSACCQWVSTKPNIGPEVAILYLEVRAYYNPTPKLSNLISHRPV